MVGLTSRPRAAVIARCALLACALAFTLACTLACTAWVPVHAEPAVLDDQAMADVAGGDGIGFAVHLEMNSAVLSGAELNSRLVAGFDVDGIKTYAIALNPGGIIDMYAMTLNLRTRPDGGDYLDIGLPFFVGVEQFGFRAFGVQSSPTATITNNYGSLLLNGHVAMQGHLYLWAQ